MGAAEVARFLAWLATERHLASGTQNQALSALLFLYRDVLGLDIGDLGQVPRAKSSTHVPVVFSVNEVRAVVAELDGVPTRFHLHESAVRRAVTDAARRIGVTKRVTCHAFRHSFAILRANMRRIKGMEVDRFRPGVSRWLQP